MCKVSRASRVQVYIGLHTSVSGVGILAVLAVFTQGGLLCFVQNGHRFLDISTVGPRGFCICTEVVATT